VTSQADSAGSIPVTRSSVNAAQRDFSLTEAELSPCFRARVPDLGTPASGVQPVHGLLSEVQESSEAPTSLTTP
jgi:hypothetical protein